MATLNPFPTQSLGQQPPIDLAKAAELAAEQAVVSSLHEPAEGDLIQLNPALSRLPVELDVAIPVREFRIRHLLALEAGQVVETDWAHGEDMPLAAGDVQLAWSEFEVVDSQLAVRVTRLA